jgi:hypothetical protein
MPSLLVGWIFVGLLVIVVLYSYGVYLLFERNTPAARRVVWKIVRHRGLGDATTT